MTAGVAADRDGNRVARLTSSEECRLRNYVVQRMPAMLRLLNGVHQLVPPDGIMRELMADQIWYAPGQVKAAWFLWDRVRSDPVVN